MDNKYHRNSVSSKNLCYLSWFPKHILRILYGHIQVGLWACAPYHPWDLYIDHRLSRLVKELVLEQQIGLSFLLEVILCHISFPSKLPGFWESMSLQLAVRDCIKLIPLPIELLLIKLTFQPWSLAHGQPKANLEPFLQMDLVEVVPKFRWQGLQEWLLQPPPLP